MTSIQLIQKGKVFAVETIVYCCLCGNDKGKLFLNKTLGRVYCQDCKTKVTNGIMEDKK